MAFSLRNTSIMIMLIALVFTALMTFGQEGATFYNRALTAQDDQLLANITGAIASQEATAHTFEQRVEELDKDTSIVNAVLLITTSLLNTIKLLASNLSLLLGMFTAIARYVPFPSYVLITITSALTFLVSFLILDAILRNKKT